MVKVVLQQWLNEWVNQGSQVTYKWLQVLMWIFQVKPNRFLHLHQEPYKSLCHQKYFKAIKLYLWNVLQKHHSNHLQPHTHTPASGFGPRWWNIQTDNIKAVWFSNLVLDHVWNPHQLLCKNCRWAVCKLSPMFWGKFVWVFINCENGPS